MTLYCESSSSAAAAAAPSTGATKKTNSKIVTMAISPIVVPVNALSFLPRSDSYDTTMKYLWCSALMLMKMTKQRQQQDLSLNCMVPLMLLLPSFGLCGFDLLENHFGHYALGYYILESIEVETLMTNLLGDDDDNDEDDCSLVVDDDYQCHYCDDDEDEQ